jgi:methionyl-tRNA synthetase
VDNFYITTPIYYVNGPPHLGHTYTTVVADTLSRFAKLEGHDTFFLTGTDEHGTKNYQSARDLGIEPQQWGDEISGMFRDLWPTMNVENDDFIRTSETRHAKVVQAILQRLWDKEEIYLADYEGLYCSGCERFLDEDDLVDGTCPDHGVAPDFVRQQNYFFKMSKYQDWLIDHITENPEFIRPERYRNEVLSFLKRPLRDLSISRPKSILPWGISLPFDDSHVTYVWADALINYVSALGWPDGERYNKYWPVCQHITAKDILKPHGIYWPCILKAADIPVYQHLNVHGFWRGGDGRKMSKTLGNTIEPDEIRDRYGADVFRYALLREMPYGLDANISETIIAERNNTDLSNDLGNLVSRTMKLSARSFGDTVPPCGATNEADDELRDCWITALPKLRKAWHSLKMSQAIEEVMECIGATNRYIDAHEPWKLAKDESQKERLGTILYHGFESLRIASTLLWPVMPKRMELLREQLGISEEPTLGECEQWGVLESGSPTRPGDGLFPRADLEEVRARDQAKVEIAAAEVATSTEPDDAAEADAQSELVTFDEFKRTDLRVGIVLTAEPVKKTNKLLKLTVDIGESEPRQLVAGIAESYTPEQIVGKRVVIVANLEPATIRGVESQGMILAAETADGLAVIEPGNNVEPGAEVR